MVRLKATTRGIEVHGRISSQELKSLKRIIPKHKRNFVWEEKVWIVENSELQKLRIVLNQNPSQPSSLNPVPPVESIKIFRIFYIGTTKVDYNHMARGTLNPSGDGEWFVIFPKQALEDWFSFGPPKPKKNLAHDLNGNFYQVLGLDEKSSKQEIKSNYRKLAKQYHPDITKSNGDEFRIISSSYEVLSDPQKKSLYDAGLSLEKISQGNQSRFQKRQNQFGDFSPPQKCGDILVKGEERLGLFFVKSILKWNQIIGDGGKILETRWDSSSNKLRKIWV